MAVLSLSVGVTSGVPSGQGLSVVCQIIAHRLPGPKGLPLHPTKKLENPTLRLDALLPVSLRCSF